MYTLSRQPRECGYPLTKPLMYFGIVYQTIGEQSHDTSLCHKALAYYLSGFREAARLRAYSDADDLFANLINLSYTIGKMQEVREPWTRYRTLNPLNPSELYSYNLRLADGLWLLSQHDYTKALSTFKALYLSTPPGPSYVRHRYIAHYYQSRVLSFMGRYPESIAILEQECDTSRHYHIKDMQLEIYRTLAEDYQKAGMEQDRARCERLYFVLKDSLVNYQQLASVGEANMLSTLFTKNKEIEAANSQRHRQTIVLGFVAAIASVTIVFLLLLGRSYRRLRRRTRALYKKNREMLQKEDEYRQRMRQIDKTA